MCVIIVNKEGVLIDEKTFKKCALINRDGMGMMIAADGKIQIYKEIDDVKSFHELYEQLRMDYPNNKIVIHFRMATQGKVDLSNVHPFMVHDDLAFAHNGIISGLEVNYIKSDTIIYKENILQKLPPDFYKNATILKLLEKYGGGYNKFVFMDSSGDVVILGEENGSFDDDKNWFSNTYFDWDRKYDHQNNINYGGYDAGYKRNFNNYYH